MAHATLNIPVMRNRFILILLCLVPTTLFSQIFNSQGTAGVLEAQRAYVQAYGQMTQRAIQISHTVQPYRQLQYEKYLEGKYEEAIDICLDVRKRYTYYAFDDRAIRDMLSLAGDCAMKISAHETAIDFYLLAKQAEEKGMDSKLQSVFNSKMNDARDSFRNDNYSKLWDDVSIALKTGWESGECYYYFGFCYERNGNYKDAKKMYKLAKKKNYPIAEIALKNLKKMK